MQKIVENLPNCAIFSLEKLERQNPSPSRFKKPLKLIPKVFKLNENNEQEQDIGFGEYADQEKKNVESQSQM